MSFEQLMTHARDIQRRAIEEELELMRRRIGDDEDGVFDLEAPVESMRPQIERKYADVTSLFQPFAEMPDPSSFDGVINQLSQVLGILSAGEAGDAAKDPVNGTIFPANPKLTKVGGTESYIEDWTGPAASAFKSEFIDPFPAVVQNQFIVASVLKSALEAQREIWKNARADIDKIAEDVLTALDRMHDCGKNKWTMTFTVMASVAAIAAVPLTAGASTFALGLAVTAVGAASQVAAAAAPDDPPAIQFSGESPEVIILQMRRAIQKLYEGIADQEAKIADAMQKTNSLVDQHRDMFVTKQPALSRGHPGNIRDLMGYSR